MDPASFLPEHLGLAARDSAALARWYQQAFGATVHWSDGQEPPAFLLAMEGGFKIEIYPADAIAAGSDHNRVPGLRHLALRVDRIEHARDHLAGRGVVFSEPIKPAGGGGRVLFFRDPEGNLIHLVERSSTS